MATQRYRIHFVASFDHIVEAPSIERAREIAKELETMPSIAVTSATTSRCAWNTIEPLGSND